MIALINYALKLIGDLVIVPNNNVRIVKIFLPQDSLNRLYQILAIKFKKKLRFKKITFRILL